ncbi:ATP-dependent DNA helicase [Corynebacterium sp.]|uniref:ATP-dependent DNA helicase n=1 Tax=Corynebacterium sp. TaxID=1720 RepID=UPI0026DF09AD|nr:ATP-dependent DNA helicase [Corynebacterium sp.]MDO5512248.1 ATP-dependent DNA helicase [Corynebacterium sp.]
MTSPAPTPEVRLVAREDAPAPRTWSFPLPQSGVWRVTGPAGSGVSSLLVDTVLERIAAGADPTGILVVASSKETGAMLRRELTDRLSGSNFASEAPLVRSIHSLAFALLRQASEEPIRLITGAEQDAVIRDLLAGHAEEGRGLWPEENRPALTFVGFARQLRDFLLRAAERGLSPEDLQTLGQHHGRGIWTAAGDFLREYEQTMALSAASSYRSYSASELVSATLEKPVESQWHTLIVDDAQHLDPTSAELIRRLIPGTELVVIGGDPDQSIFRFRGATPEFLHGLEVSDEIRLPESRRRPSRDVVIVDSPTVQHAFIADRIRRAHLLDGVAYSDIAVIVRSTGQLTPVRRALLAAGVPVHLNPTDVVLSEQRIVANLLLGVRALTEDLGPADLENLLLGPVGGADPVTLRRLVRGLRRFDPGTRGMDTLRSLLLPDAPLPDFGALLTDREQAILDRIRGVLEAGRAALGGGVEDVLWAVWSATGLSDHLLAASLRGGATGSQADRDLDAMMALFDAAGDYAERRPTGSLRGFLTHIEEQELPTGVRDRRLATPEAVTLLTAHGTVGGQWEHVIVAGAQEGAWPSLGSTGSLFGQEELVELVDAGIDPDLPVSHTSDRLKEERRLFHVATSRAVSSLLITAVHAPDAGEPTEPSRFIDDYCATHDIELQRFAADPAAEKAEYQPLHVRLLSVAGLLAELRRVVCDESARADERDQAARQLARLAQAGVPGADPQQWWTTTSMSSGDSLPAVTALSPSRIEGLLTCPLREVIQRLVTDEETPEAMVRGSLVHAFFEALGRGADPEEATALTVAAWESLQKSPSWMRQAEKEAFTSLLRETAGWLRARGINYTPVGVEVGVDVEVADGVRIRGRMDLLDKDSGDRHWVVDLKTARSAVSHNDAEAHLQLLAYQLALSRGVVRDGEVTDPLPGEAPLQVAGGKLVFPAHVTDKHGVAERDQMPRTPEQLEEFAHLLPPLLEDMRGPVLTARANDHCERCTVRGICPIQPEGKVITRA